VTAVERGKEAGWDLIVLDVMLPRRDGFDVCRDLRRARVRTPIIILTAKAQEAEKILGWSSAPTITSPSRSALGNFARDQGRAAAVRGRLGRDLLYW